MTWFSGLTGKQRRFIEEFSANGGNATKAARDAGYSHPTTQGPRMLENVGIRNAVEAVRMDATNRASLAREKRQAFWSRVMRGEEMYRDPKSGQMLPYSMEARLRASELLGRAQGDFVQRREVASQSSRGLKIVKI